MFTKPLPGASLNGIAAQNARRFALALLAIFFVPAQLFAAAQAEEPGVMTEFYSYLPAVPDIKLPEINIPFWTDDLKRAKKAYKSGNYDRAVKFFRRASEDGNIVADWYLGHMYRLGRGVPRDDASAYSYYARVAELYDSDEPDQNRLKITIDAMVRVADYQRTGVASAGIAANPAAAAHTYLKIATVYGHPAAQYALGLMNIKGQGMKRNPQQGLKWLIASARKRHASSEAYLGELYLEGKLVRADRTRAVMWYILAKQSTRPEENPEIFDRAAVLEGKLSEDERLEAEARARVWTEQYPSEHRVNAAAEQ
ncbi:MAG TPA: tetratricopeptide repeat protein [Aestuariivirga sp.]|nr:tetratricopeptide repeat protein [Aestuariivirga sp.]